ncbi:MAG: Zn-binding domain-containing protein [Brevinematia bacterium]
MIFFPTDNILDNYYYNNPNDLFSDEIESLAANVFNDRIIGYYIALAIISYNEALGINKNFISSVVVRNYWGDNGIFSIERFIEKSKTNILMQSRWYDGETYFFTQLSKNDIRNIINIRGIGKSFSIYDTEINKEIGEIPLEYIFSECHQGGIYVHMGESYKVQKVDFENNLVLVTKTSEDYSTEVLNDKDIEILGTIKSNSYYGFSVNYSKMRVKEVYKGFLTLKYSSRIINGQVVRERKVIDVIMYPQPYVLEYDTEGIVILFDGEKLRKILNYSEDISFLRNNNSLENIKLNEENILLSGLHSAEHSIIGMYPSEVVCVRNEIGGLSYMSKGVQPAIVIYEAIDGGVGYSEIAFNKLDKIVKKALFSVEGCMCVNDSGCPSCIQSPKCGNGNLRLSKRIGKKVLKFLLEGFEKPVNEQENIVNQRIVRYSVSYLRNEHPELEENDKYAYYDLLEFPLESFRKPIVFDLETQKYSYEVGGWDNAKDMLLAIAVVYDIKKDEFIIFNESNVKSLIDMLLSSDIVIGYNTRNFDYKVLSRYDGRFENSDNIKTFDILNDLIKKHVGDLRISLDNLVRNNLNGRGKNSSSHDMPQFYREGKIEAVIKHCKEDVMFTYMIMKKILEDRFIRFEKNGTIFTIEFSEVLFRFKL